MNVMGRDEFGIPERRMIIGNFCRMDALGASILAAAILLLLALFRVF